MIENRGYALVANIQKVVVQDDGEIPTIRNKTGVYSLLAANRRMGMERQCEGKEGEREEYIQV